MKSLYESILSSTNTGKNNYIKNLILNPTKKIKEVNEIWKSLKLELNIGDGDGYWEMEDDIRAQYVVPKKVRGTRIICPVASIGKGFMADIVIGYHAEFDDKDITEVKNWAEKIQKTINTDIKFVNNHIFLNFLR